MKDENKTKAQLIDELNALRRQKAIRNQFKIERDKAQQYLDVAGVMFVMIGADQVVKMINPKGCEILGYSESEIVGKNWFDHFIPHVQIDTVKRVFNKIMKGEIAPVEYYENPVLTKYGKERIIAWHNTTITDDEGKIIGTLSSGEDVTGKKEAEEELRKINSFNQTLLNTSPDVIYVYDLERRTNVYTNEKIIEIAGYTATEIKEFGDHLIQELMHPDDFKIYLSETVPKYEQAKDGELIENVFRMKHKQGHWLWLNFRETIFKRNDEGKPKQILGMISDITEKKMAEEALRESEEKYRLISETTPDLISLFNMEGNLVFTNSAGAEMYGYKRENMIGMHFSEFVLEERLEETQKIFKDVLSSGEIVRGELFVEHKKGYEFPIYYSMSVIENQGEATGFICTARDITEQKTAEESLRISEEKYSSIIRETLDGFGITDLKGNFLEVNDSLCNMLGYTREEMTELRISDIENTESHEQTRERIHKILKQGYDSFDSRLLNKNGSIVDVIIQVRLSSDGKSLYAFLKDITANKKAEERLRQSEEKFRSFFENSVMGIYRTTPDGEILAVNPTLLSLLGYSSLEELKKRNLELEGYEPGYERSIFKETIAKEGKIIGLESAWVKSDGTILPVRENAITLKDETGTILYYEGTVEDITERKAAEEALTKSEENLRKAQEIANIGSWIWYADENRVEVSDQMYTILGVKKGDTLPLFNTDASLIHPDDKDRFSEIVTNAMQEMKPFSLDYRIHRADNGALRHLHVDTEISKDEISKQIIVYGTVQDITERMQAEETLRVSEKRYRNLINNLHAGVVVHEPDTSIILTNPKASELLGLTEDQMRGKTAIDEAWHFSTEDGKQMGLNDYPVNRVLSTGVSLSNYIVGINRPDLEKPLWVLVNAYPEYEQSKKMTQITVSFVDITDIKIAEQAMRISEAKFKGLFENSPDIIALADLKGIIIDINKVAPNYNKEDVIGSNFTDNLNPAQTKVFFDTVEKAVESGESAGYEVDIMNQDGQLIHWYNRISPIQTEEQVEQVVIHCTDITERVQTEKMLRESEEKFRVFFNHSPDMYVSVSAADASIQLCNDTVLEKTGYTREEVIGIPIFKMYHEDCMDDVKAAFQQFVETGMIRDKELILKTKDGAKIDVNLQVNSVKNADGKILYSISSWRDITERKRAAEELLLKNNVFESSLAANSIANNKGVVTHVNQAFVDQWGFESREDAIGNTVADFFVDVNDAGSVLEALNSTGKWEGDFLAKRQDGTHFISRGAATVVRDTDGKQIGYQSANLDVTIQRSAEQELENKNLELEQILYATSHDLRSPLVNIQGFNKELIAAIHELNAVAGDLSLTPEQSKVVTTLLETDIPESIHYILSSTAKMDSLLSGLLKISRLGRQTLQIKKLDMDKLISTVLKTFKFQIKAKKVKVHVSPLPKCRGDMSQINQVFSNLIANALKFLNPDRTGEIMITGKQEGFNSIYAIEDNGIGIHPDHQLLIFNLFHQLDPGVEGEGLGLSIIRRILDRHSGSISVESHPNQGSQFIIRLPGM